MPLAATRARVGGLPLRFRFDDSMALAGGRKISGFKTIRIEARIAKAGQAQTSSGDLYGTLAGVKPGSQGLPPADRPGSTVNAVRRQGQHRLWRVRISRLLT